MNQMSLSTATILYHMIGLGLLLAAVIWFYRKRSWWRFLESLLAIGAASLFISVLLSVPGFNPLRAARLLCFGWFIHVPLFLVAASVSPGERRIRVFSFCTIIVTALIVWFSFFVEPFRLEITEYRVPSAKVATAMRIGVLADFQTDVFGSYEKQSLLKLMSAKPDMIVIPGDILQANSRAEWELLRDQMNGFLRDNNFAAPLGVYAVGGNTDFQDRWPEIFDGLNVHCMKTTRTIEADDFVVTGLSVPDSFDPRLQISAQSKFHITVGHAPDFSLSPGTRADLLIAGHTHGGQVRLPIFGPIVTFSRVPKSWAAGLTQIDAERTLVVSRGVGMERRDAPRIRFLCRPQIVLVDVVPK